VAIDYDENEQDLDKKLKDLQENIETADAYATEALASINQAYESTQYSVLFAERGNPLREANARVAAADQMLKEMIIAVEDDLDRHFVQPMMVRIRTVHRSIMLVCLPLDFHDAVVLGRLVIDELGHGELHRAHAQMTALDIEKWGDTVDWHAPVESTEMKAMLNWNLRTVTHPDQLWSFTGIFCVEWNSYLELRAALVAFRQRGIKDDMMEVLVQHGDGDPYDKDQHALLVRQELGRRIKTPEDAAQVYTGIAYHQGLYHSFFEGEFAKLRRSVESAA
jgi:hypothetical protein